MFGVEAEEASAEQPSDEPVALVRGGDGDAQIREVRSRRHWIHETARNERLADAAERAAVAERKRAALVAANDRVLRVAAWLVTLHVVLAVDVMDSQSTAILRGTRELQRQRAQRVLTQRLPPIFRMFVRRQQRKRLRRVATTVLAAVKFKSLLRHVAIRCVRHTLVQHAADTRGKFRRAAHAWCRVRTLLRKKVVFRQHHQGLLKRQFDAMELYLTLTRPELVFSATELRFTPGVHGLDSSTQRRVREAILRRYDQIGIAAAESSSEEDEQGGHEKKFEATSANGGPQPFPGDVDDELSRSGQQGISVEVKEEEGRGHTHPGTLSTAPNLSSSSGAAAAAATPQERKVPRFVPNGVLGQYTMVPPELIPLAYGDAPYYDFLAVYRKHCAARGCPLVPNSALREQPEYHVIPANRSRETSKFARSFLRRQNGLVRSGLSAHFAKQSTAQDALQSALRSRKKDAHARVRDRYPTVQTQTALHAELVELEVESNRGSPLLQAMLERCYKALRQPLPARQRLSVLMDRFELQGVVEHCLYHSKLRRLLRQTGTRVPDALID